MTEQNEKRKEWLAISRAEEDEKAKATPFARGLKNCEGEPPDPDVAASYPHGQAAQYPYNFEDQWTGRPVSIRYQDGHHPDDREDLDHAQIGGTQHVHDDAKRMPPEILDQNSEQSQIGFYATSRVPEKLDDYEKGDDTNAFRGEWRPEDRATMDKNELSPDAWKLKRLNPNPDGIQR